MEETVAAVRECAKRNLTRAETAKELNLTYSTVTQLAKRKKIKFKATWEMIPSNVAIAKMIEEGKSEQEMCKVLGWYPYKVRSAVNSIKRKTGQSKKIETKYVQPMANPEFAKAVLKVCRYLGKPK